MKTKNKNCVWVIECMCDDGNWLPCANAQLTREDARRELRIDWKRNYPDGKFRIVKYISTTK